MPSLSRSEPPRPITQSVKPSWVLLGSTVITVVLIDSGQDISTWMHCFFADFDKNNCATDPVQVVKAQALGLGISAVLAIMFTTYAALQNNEPARQVITAIGGIVIAGLIGLADITLSEKKYPDFKRYDTELYIGAVIAISILLPILGMHKSASARQLRLLGVRMAIGFLLGLVVSYTVLYLPGDVGLPELVPTDPYFVKAYSIVPICAAWAVMLAMPELFGSRLIWRNRHGKSGWYCFAGLVTFLLAAGFGLMKSIRSKEPVLAQGDAITETGIFLSLLVLGTGVIVGFAGACASHDRSLRKLVWLCAAFVFANAAFVAFCVVAIDQSGSDLAAYGLQHGASLLLIGAVAWVAARPNLRWRLPKPVH
ncbi:MAG: hypothetical protein AAGL89_03290 [Pseudomonadota bacterium]